MTHGTAGEFPAEAMARRKMTTGEMITLSLLWFPMNMFWTAMLTYILPTRVQDLAGETAEGQYLFYISLVGSVASVGVQLLVAPLSDACTAPWGRRRHFIFWGILLNAIVSVGFVLTGHFWALLLYYFAIQLAQNTASAPYQALLPDNIHPAQEGIASTYMGGALLLGQLGGAFLLLFGRKPLGITGMMYVLVALLSFAALIVVWRVPDRPARSEEAQSVGKSLASVFDLRLGQYPDFVRVMGSRFFINLCYNSVTSYLLFYLQKAMGLGKDGGATFLNYLLLTATLAGLIGTVGAAYGLRRLTLKQMVYISCAMLGTAALVFSLTSNTALVLAMGFLFGAGWGVFQAVDWALAVKLLPPGGTARYMAVWHLCLELPRVLALIFGGLWDTVNQHFGNGYGWRAAFLITVLYIGFGAMIIRGIKETPTQGTV